MLAEHPDSQASGSSFGPPGAAAPYSKWPTGHTWNLSLLSFADELGLLAQAFSVGQATGQHTF